MRSVTSSSSDFQYHRHDQRPSLVLPRDVPLQIGADFLLDHAVVGFLFGAGGIERFDDDLPDALDHTVVAGIEPARHNLGRGLDASGEFVDGDERHHEPVFAEMAAVFDNNVFDHVSAGAGIDTDAAHIDAAGLAGAELIDFENVSSFDQHHFANRSSHGAGQLGVQLELPVFAVDGDEIFRPYEVDDELQFFLAAVSADVNRRVRAVVIDDECFASEQVVHHAVDGFFVTGNNARRQHDGIAFFDFGVLVVIHRRPRQRGHRFALRAADEDAHFLRRKVLHFTGMDQHAFGNLDIPEVFGDLGRILHGAAEETDFAAVLPRHVDGQLDTVNGGRETGDEQTPLGADKYLFELAVDRALARSVALALDVGGILQERQHSLFAVLGETVQIEEAIVGGCRIDLEVAGVQHDAERRLNG